MGNTAGTVSGDTDDGVGKKELTLSAYEGQFQGGVREGRGTDTWPDGARFDGEYHADEREGLGTWTFPDGASWTGPWRSDEPRGQGTWRFPRGGGGAPTQVAGAGPTVRERIDDEAGARRAAAPAQHRAAADAAAQGLDEDVRAAAARRGNGGEVRALHARGADVRAPDNDGRTPVYIAAGRGGSRRRDRRAGRAGR